MWSRIDGLNGRLHGICEELGCDFVDLRGVLDECKRPLDASGVHYTREAASRVAYRLACSFLG